MKAKYLIIIIAFGFFSSTGFAQEEEKKYTAPSIDIDQLVAISWEINVPSGDLVSKTSLAGGRFEYRKFLNEKFSLGLGISFSSVEQYFPTKTYENPEGSTAVTTDMIRQVFTMPMTIVGHYYPTISSPILKPFLGLGMGAQYSTQDIYYNIYVIDNSNWGFVVKPEIGTLIAFSEKTAALASIGYTYATNKVENLKIDDFKQVSFNIGLAFMIE